MASKAHTVQFIPQDNARLSTLCGHCNVHLKQIENHLGISISQRGDTFQLSGQAQAIAQAKQALGALYEQTEHSHPLTANDIHMVLCETAHKKAPSTGKKAPPPSKNTTTAKQRAQLSIRTPHITVTPRNANQIAYLQHMQSHDINFGLGPSGTGKTYLAVAAAVQALEKEEVKRIILVRPAVEAGEALGFLPGDLAQKINPYLRPLYDALHDMLGGTQVHRLVERDIIEIAPLAYMRGRTLNEAFIILDEGQNSTSEQMKMCLTRIGFGSRAVITGDVSQTDLPKHIPSGLAHAMNVLQGIDGIAFTQFASQDVVRHPLVQDIVNAYDAFEANHD